jgi:hypothetical protein
MHKPFIIHATMYKSSKLDDAIMAFFNDSIPLFWLNDVSLDAKNTPNIAINEILKRSD